MDYDDKWDVRKLYPVQGKVKNRLFAVSLDEKHEDEENGGNEDRVSLPNAGKKKRNRFEKAASAGQIQVGFANPSNYSSIRSSNGPHQSSRRSSDTSQATKNRRASAFPLPRTSVPGPNGRRQSAWVDYSFYNERIATIPDLVSKQVDERTKARAMWQDAAAAMKKVRLQGLREFMHAVSIMSKAFWLLLFVACLSILIYEVGKAIGNYYTSPITTTFTIRTPQAISFPDIYICFGNALNRSYIRQHPEAVKGIQNLYATVVGGDKRRKKRGASFDFEDYRMPWDRKIEHVMESWIRSGQHFENEEEDGERERWRRSADTENRSSLEEWNNNGEISYNFLLKAGFQVNQTFLNCSFRSYKSHSYECNQIVRTVMDPNYFTCYVVSVPKDEKQVVANRGLRLLINSQVSNYPLVRDNDTEPNKYAGLFVSISDRFDPTNWYKGVVSPGTLTKLTLSATKVNLLNTQTGNLRQPCVEDGSFQYRIFNTSYSRTACQMDCLVYAFYRNCKCVFKIEKSIVKSNIMQSTPFCAFSHTSSCLVPNVTNSSSVIERVNKCRRRCYTPCNSVRYQIRGSSSILNPGAFPKTLPVKDLVQLEVSFGRLEVSELTQAYSKTLAQVIADVGGHVNLWLGASMITLLEIPIFVTAYCCYRSYQKLSDTMW